MSMTHIEALKTLDTTYRQNHGLKLQNNTRLVMRGTAMNCEFGVILHGTEVVTIHRDNTFTLRSGGYCTPTTMDRIRRYSPAKLFSERGEWYLWTKPTKRDPRPDRVERSVFKPYDCPEDPGPEPVKTHTGWTAREDVARDDMVCIAGSRTEQPYWEYKRLYEYSGSLHNDKAASGIYVSQRYYDDGSGPYKAAHEAGIERSFYGEKPRGYYDDLWSLFTGKKSYQAGETHFIGEQRWEYKQCPHCAAFDNLHRRWKTIMYGGDGWHRNQRFDAPRGFDGYNKAVAEFGSREAWQAAYLNDLRERRAYLAADREWEQRNRVPFFDGILVDNDGWASKLRATGPSPAKLRRHEARVKRVKLQIDRYVKGYIEKLTKGMPMPGQGDCWYCLMHTADGTAMGDLAPEAGDRHLFSHMSERYYVPQLAVNALRERGYKDVGIYMWLNMRPEDNVMGGGDKKQYDGVARDITKYMRKRLVPAAPTN